METKSLKKTKTTSRRSFMRHTGVAGLGILASRKIGRGNSRPVPRVQTSESTIRQKVDGLIAQMTLDEKIQMVHGDRLIGFIGYVPAIPRLGVPELTLTDAPAGIRP